MVPCSMQGYARDFTRSQREMIIRQTVKSKFCFHAGWHLRLHSDDTNLTRNSSIILEVYKFAQADNSLILMSPTPLCTLYYLPSG
mmetsp:Transcript_96687/g.166682  ORF Transcript_96687/g.166682 Transcript_96687/m.166682 type:complete len:85 (+) Transcript_96687:1110-1364(+)